MDRVERSSDRGPRVYDGSSIVAFAIGLASLGSFALSPVIAGFVGLVAVAAAMASRRRLRQDSSLRGSRLSLAGFLLGGIALAIAFGPLVIAVVVSRS
ncbi:MAG: hypothetical protein JWM70_1634 [Microbacteriaceae bacterium]|jgi:hypothetical protein|nr:hypothetical protein [Microbacteriaceae bacterium]